MDDIIKGDQNCVNVGYRNLGGGASYAPLVSLADQQVIDAGFGAVGSSVLDSAFVQTPIVTGGVTYNQASGSLNIVSSTNANAEFLARSVLSFNGSARLRYSFIASQRIVNNNFAILLADLIGESLAVTINNATSITVAIPNHSFTSQNVGQFLNVGGIVGAAGVPGRYAIASVIDGVSINLTVAGWPASGSCTATLFGRNYIRNLFTGTTATNVAFDSQRNGWATGDTTATINTTASPGVVIANEITGRDVFISDALRASSTTPTFTTRASRYENIPMPDTQLFVFLWSFNGTSAPASATTWTLGHVSVENFPNVPVYIQGQRAQGAQNPAPVAIQSGTLPTVTTVSTVTTLSNGQAAHDAVIAGAPHRIAGRAVTANYTAVATGDVADLITTTVGAQIIKPYAIPEAGWNASLALTTTTAAAIQTAAGAGLKRHVTACQAINTGASAVDLIILDGATERWRLTLPVNTPVVIPFPTEIVTTANTALNANLSAAGTVRANFQGYTAP